MKTICFFLLLLASLHSDVWDPDGMDDKVEDGSLLVSLGSHCVPASIIRLSGLRKAAFPFDWILSLDNDGIIQILEDDFAYFLDEEFLVPDSLLLPKAQAENLVHLKYHIEFVHEGNFRSDYFQNLQKLKEKYARRVQRFRDLGSFPGTVYFLRCNYIDAEKDVHRSFKPSGIVEISDEEAFKIYTALKNRFPILKFKLVIINQSQPFDGQLHIEESFHEDIIKTRIRASGDPLFELYSLFFHSLPDINR